MQADFSSLSTGDDFDCVHIQGFCPVQVVFLPSLIHKAGEDQRTVTRSLVYSACLASRPLLSVEKQLCRLTACLVLLSLTIPIKEIFDLFFFSMTWQPFSSVSHQRFFVKESLFKITVFMLGLQWCILKCIIFT